MDSYAWREFSDMLGSFHFHIYKYGITLPNGLVRKWKQNTQ